MKCELCKSRNLVFNEALGENVCSECGYGNVTAPFEKHVLVKWDDYGQPNKSPDKGHLGSYIGKSEAFQTRKHHLWQQNVRTETWASHKRKTATKEVDTKMMMYLSEYGASKDLKESAKAYYLAMFKDDYLRGYSNERKAAGVTFFVLKEAGIITILDKHARITRVYKRYLSKIAKKIAKYARKSYVFAKETPQESVDSLLGNMKKVTESQRNAAFLFIEYVSRVYEDLNMRLSNNRIGAGVWIATKMISEPITQTDIVKYWLCSDYGIRNNAKEMCELLSIDKASLSCYDIEDVVKGIRVRNENENGKKNNERNKNGVLLNEAS